MGLTEHTAQIITVDDHPLVRYGLRELIDAEDDLTICGEADSGEMALDLVERLSPHLAIVDIALNGISGIELTKRLHARYPNLRILVSSMYDAAIYAERAIRAGAHGFINKGDDVANMLKAIRHVLAGNVYLSDEASSSLLRKLLSSGEDKSTTCVSALSDRELEVFELIGRGLATREIANQLHLSVKTIETHRLHIKSKLSITTSAELVRLAVCWSLDNT